MIFPKSNFVYLAYRLAQKFLNNKVIKNNCLTQKNYEWLVLLTMKEIMLISNSKILAFDKKSLLGQK
jgi:hypothetical protein